MATVVGRRARRAGALLLPRAALGRAAPEFSASGSRISPKDVHRAASAVGHRRPASTTAGGARSPSAAAAAAAARRRRRMERASGQRRGMGVGSSIWDLFGGGSSSTKAEKPADVVSGAEAAEPCEERPPPRAAPSPSPSIPSFPPPDPNSGLFSLPGLRSPPDFLRLSREAVAKCDDLRSRLAAALSSDTAASSAGNAIDTLHLLDEISNTVCSVIDAAELCRSAHASPVWRDAAEDAFGLLSGYIAELNADDNLYRSLVGVTSNREVFENLNEEQRRFAVLLKEEFERDGIHLPPELREEVREVVGHVTTLEGLFNANVTRARKFFDVSGDAENIIPRHVLRSVVPEEEFTEERGMTTVSSDPHVANTLLKYSANPSLRREVYREIHTLCPENLDVLDNLIDQRHRLATLQGYESYADRFLQDKMAQSPANVRAFLESVRSGVDGAYRRDMALLSRAKDRVEAGGGRVEPWDVPFYSGILKAQMFGSGASDGGGELGGYFTVEGCVEGMAVLVDRLFGISMVEAPITRVESWDLPDDAGAPSGPASHLARDDAIAVESAEPASAGGKIRKFHFAHPEEGPLGTVYLDLHPREGKYAHAAHFTVRCGCAVRSPDGSYGDSSNVAAAGAKEGTEYQLPIVALVCNLSPPHSEASGGASLLSHSEVETLLHEFGHALHSLLGRTHFQHLAGTRAAMDFIETPSHVFENYAWDPTFLRMVGRHHATGQSLDERTIQDVVRGRFAFKALEAQTQIVYAKFDQEAFGPPPPNGGPRPSTTDLFAKLHREHGVPYANGTHFHSRFGHLVTYGAGYYGYLYSQVFASDIWSTVLSPGANSGDAGDRGGSGSGSMGREGGMRLWNEVLRHGGARDPRVMLRRVLGGRDPRGDGFFRELRWR